MASRECDISDECLNIGGISESLWNQLDHEQLPNFLDDDGDYVEMWQNKTELEREEHAREKVALFLEEFPAQRKEIEKCINCLWEMANAIDKTHKHCTVASLAASSTSASSGILTVLGMTLAPFTAGGSLILTTGGLGLGVVAATAGLSASIYESVSTSKETRKAQELMLECGRSLQMAMCPDEAEISSKLPTNNDAVGGNIENLVRMVHDVYKTLKRIETTVNGIKTNVKALKYVQANTGLNGLANRAAEAGMAFWGGKPVENAVGGNVENLVRTVADQFHNVYKAVNGIETNVQALTYVQANTGLNGLANRAAEAGMAFWGKVWGTPVEKAIAGTTLAMTEGARLLGAATAGAFVLLDAYKITQNAKHLSEGAKAEKAAEIRDKARKLEAELQELNKLYEELQNKLN